MHSQKKKKEEEEEATASEIVKIEQTKTTIAILL